MRTFLLLCGNAMLGMLDLFMGAFIVLLVSHVTGHEFAWWAYLIGAVLAASPDFDVLYMFLRKGKVYGDHHEWITHRPVIGISLAVILGYAFGGALWSATAGICLFWHYLHDTHGFGGGGIAWFWPFSKTYWSPIKPPIQSHESVMHGDHNEALGRIILSPSKKSVSEIMICSIITFLAVWHLTEWHFGVLAGQGLWLLIGGVWLVARIHKEKNNQPAQ